MRRMPVPPKSIRSTKPNNAPGILKKSETQPIFSETVLDVDLIGPVSVTCPDVLTEVKSSVVRVEKKYSYTIDFPLKLSLHSESIVTSIAGRWLRLWFTIQNAPVESLSKFKQKVQTLNGIVTVAKIDNSDGSRQLFYLVLTPEDIVLWKEIRPIETLFAFEKLLRLSFNDCFLQGILLYEKYLAQSDSIRSDLNDLAEKLLVSGVHLKDSNEVEFFFNSKNLKWILDFLSVLRFFEKQMSADFWKLLMMLNDLNALHSQNAYLLIPLSSQQHAKITVNILEKKGHFSLHEILREISQYHDLKSPANLHQLVEVSDTVSLTSSGSNMHLEVTGKSATLFPRSPNASPSRKMCSNSQIKKDLKPNACSD